MARVPLAGHRIVCVKQESDGHREISLFPNYQSCAVFRAKKTEVTNYGSVSLSGYMLYDVRQIRRWTHALSRENTENWQTNHARTCNA